MINLLLSLTFLFTLLIKGFKQQNTTIANILAVIFSLWLYIYDVSYGSIFNPFGTFFVVGGIISKIYFSKYYGEIIIKVGIGFLIINALLIIYVLLFNDGDFFDILTKMAHIIFWVIYFKTLTFSSKINVSVVPKNDPKDW